MATGDKPLKNQNQTARPQHKHDPETIRALVNEMRAATLAYAEGKLGHRPLNHA
jgi:hypothetical protein